MPSGPDKLDCLVEAACYTEGMLVNGIQLEEYAKLEYGRLLWRVAVYRKRLLRHWHDPRHPHAGRFAEHEAEVTRILQSPKDSDAALDAELRQRSSSLR